MKSMTNIRFHIRCKKAFSLVELSIVLVILGLLTGGILSGQALIHASAMRATIKQMTDLSIAMNGFRDKYQTLPGDMANATDFWPNPTNAIAVRNGNGNGSIEALNAATYTSNPDDFHYNGERSQFYAQLGLAGLTNGYDDSATLGKGYPAIALYPGKGMIVAGPWVGGSGSNNVNMSAYTPARIYLFMGVCAPQYLNVQNQFDDCPIFTPEEVWNMDTKLDDGLPLSGKVLAESFNTVCVTGSVPNATGSTAGVVNSYNLSNGKAACNVMYTLQ